MPVFPDVYLLDAPIIQGGSFITMPTTGRDLYAGCQLLIKSGFDFSDILIVKVKTVTNFGIELAEPLLQSFNPGVFIYPLKKAVLTDMPELEKQSDNVLSAQIRIRINEHNPHSDHVEDLPIYLNYPVFNLSPDWSEDLTGKYDRLFLELDNQVGIPVRTDLARRAFYINSFQFEALGRNEHHQLRRILYYLRGRQKAIWLPSFNDDLTPVSNIINNLFDIDYIGYSLSTPPLGRRDICIMKIDGSMIYRRILGAISIDGNTERLLLDGEALTFDKSDILRISFLTLSRLNSDSISIDYLTDADGVASISLSFWGLRDELE